MLRLLNATPPGTLLLIMTTSTAEGFIRLFGLYLIISSIIGLVKGIAGFFQGTAMFDFGFWNFEGQMGEMMAWGLVQLAISFFAGVVVLKKSKALAQTVVPS
jgi:hypothetical protein